MQRTFSPWTLAVLPAGALLLFLQEALENASASFFGRALSPDESALFYALLQEAVPLRHAALAASAGALLLVHLRVGGGRASRIVVGLACGPVVVSLLGAGPLAGGLHSALSAASVLLLAARLWMLALAVPWPGVERLTPALAEPMRRPWAWLAVPAAFHVALLFHVRGDFLVAGHTNVPPNQSWLALALPMLLGLANVTVLGVAVLASVAFAWLAGRRFTPRARLLVALAAPAALAGVVLARVFVVSVTNEAALLQVTRSVVFLGLPLALMLPPFGLLTIRRLERVWPGRIAGAGSVLALVSLGYALLPLAWAGPRLGRHGPGGFSALCVAMLSLSLALAWLVLNGTLFDPWFTVFSTIKGLLLVALSFAVGALAGVAFERRAAAAPSLARQGVAAAVLLLLCPLPARSLHFRPVLKNELMQYSEFAKVELSLFGALGGTVLSRRFTHSGETLEERPDYDPLPKPWSLEPTGRRDLPPHASLLFIVVDAMRGDMLNRFGNPRPGMTPFLDAWTRDECVTFTRAYAQGNGSYNSMAMLFGGRGRLRELTPQAAHENLVYELVQREGMPLRVTTFEHGTTNLYPRAGADLVSIGRPYHADRSPLPAGDLFARLRGALERGAPGRPFFAYAVLMDVQSYWSHRPAGISYGEGIKDLYDANMAYVDRSLRDLVAWLKRTGRYEKTVVVLTSDHGEEFKEHASTLHGHNFFEEAIRVPLILRLPGIPARTIETPVANTDFVPTLLEMFGYRPRPPFDDRFGAISLRDLIVDHGSDVQRFLRRDLLLFAMFKEKYALFRDWRYKFVYWVTYEAFALYDLIADPRERINLVEARSELVTAMQTRLLEGMRSIRGVGYAPRLPWESSARATPPEPH